MKIKQRVLPLFLAVIMLVGALPQTASAADEPINPVTDKLTFNWHTYQLFDTGRTWSEARAYCESVGGHLVTVTSASEQKFIESMVAKGKRESYWLGGYLPAGFTAVAANYKWVTNEAMSYLNWDHGEPSSFDGYETCMEIYPTTGTWNDLPDHGWWNTEDENKGTVRLGFICEWDYVESQKIPDYPPSEVVTFNGNKYQRFDTTMAWSNAKAHCESLGGHLVTITSASEQRFIENLAAQGKKNVYWTGGYRPIRTNLPFAWITEEPMVYTNWNYHEPNNLGGNEYYVIIYRTNDYDEFGKWNDEDEDEYTARDITSIGFICEWEAPSSTAQIGGLSVNPSSINAGDNVTVTATGITNALKIEFITRTKNNVHNIIFTKQNPGGTESYVATLNDADVTNIYARVYGADTNRVLDEKAVSVTVKALEKPPVAPHGGITLKAEVTSIGINLDWEPSANRFGYRVYRSETKGVTGISISDFPLKNSSTFDANVGPNKTYYYTIAEVLAEASFDSVKVELTPEKLGVRSAELVVVTDDKVKPLAPGTKRGFIMMTIGNPFMIVNDAREEIDPGRATSPLLQNGRTMVPIRAVVEAMKGTVDWNAAESRITLTANDHSAQMWLGRKDLIADGKRAAMDIAPFVHNERTLLPLRFAAENLGCQIEWIASQSRVVIVYTIKL